MFQPQSESGRKGQQDSTGKLSCNSHDNAMFIAQTCKTPFLLNDNDRLVSYLPMNHIAAQFLDAIVPTFNRTTVYMARPDALQKSLSDTMRLARPTFFLAVPRVWEKISDGINQSFLSLSVGSLIQGFIE